MDYKERTKCVPLHAATCKWENLTSGLHIRPDPPDLQQCTHGCLSEVFVQWGGVWSVEGDIRWGLTVEERVNIKRREPWKDATGKCLIINTPSVPRLLPRATDIKPISFYLQSNMIYSYNELAYLLSLDHLCKIWRSTAIPELRLQIEQTATILCTFNLFIRTPDRKAALWLSIR